MDKNIHDDTGVGTHFISIIMEHDRRQWDVSSFYLSPTVPSMRHSCSQFTEASAIFVGLIGRLSPLGYFIVF